LPIYFTHYRQFKLGPYLRRERTKRKYDNFFTFDRGLIYDIYLRILLRYKSRKMSKVKGCGSISANTVYLFDEIPSWEGYFNSIVNDREEVKKLLFQNINSDILEQVKTLSKPIFSLHIRLGDFQIINNSLDFKYNGAMRTPMNYFEIIIQHFSKSSPHSKIYIFSDGYLAELSSLLRFPNVEIFRGENDLVELLHLSNSEFIAMSAGSTFSYWAGFLGNSLLIYHDYHPPCLIRDDKKIISFSEFVTKDPVF